MTAESLHLLSTTARALMLCLMLAPAARAAQAPPDDGRTVVVLVNAASKESVAVGAHYAARRNVPKANICTVRTTTSEVVSRRQFNTQIREPVRQFLIDGGHAEESAPDGRLKLKVKYLVSTYGVPVKIREDYGKTELKDVPRVMARRDGAAVDSELSLVALPEYQLPGWVRNPLYGKAPEPQRTILLAARLDGPTPEIAKGLVDAAIDAEKSGLLGCAYIDARAIQKGAYKTGDAWMRAAEMALRKAGIFTRMDGSEATFPTDMPMRNAAFYLGWYRPALSGPMSRADFRFTRGAVAYHLHSGSAARLRRADLGWAGPLLAKGAAATMGAVFEPYLAGTPDVGEFTRRFLDGHTFAESAYAASRYVSWMITYVGDPLYAPFHGTRPATARAQARNETWREVHSVITATEAGEFDRALARCKVRKDDTLFVELAARAHLRAGNAASAIETYRKLAQMAKDDFTAIRAWDLVGNWLAGPGAADDKRPALKAYLSCVARHPRSPHSLPVYHKALALARSMRAPRTVAALWEALASNFPTQAAGRFARGELWVRGLRRDCTLPMVTATRAEVAPKIDGKIKDAAWASAGVVARLPHRFGPANGNCRAEVHLTFGDKALYVMARLPREQGLSRGASAGGEVFEMTLSPSRTGRTAIRIRVAKAGRGTVLPTGVSFKTGTLWEARGQVRADAGWVVELAIPFKAVGAPPPSKDGVWAVNFVKRCRVPKFPFRLAPAFASWAKPDTDPVAPECAGYLIFK
jgi:uncharacterized protein (TIGR03790 family)